jgi:hypothetical protein
MNGVTNDLIGHSAMRDNDGHHPLKIIVENIYEDRWIDVVRHCGKPFDIGEQRCDFTPLAPQFHQAGLFKDASHHGGREVLFESRPRQRFAVASRCEGNRRCDRTSGCLGDNR